MIAPGPLLATVSQFVPAVREAGTADAAGPLPRRGRGRRAHRLARDRRGDAARSIPADVDGDGRRSTATTSVLAGTKRFVVEGDAVDELVVVARVAGSTGDDGVRAVVVPVAATRRPRRCTRSTAAAGSRTSTSTACASAAIACSATPTRRPRPALRRALEEATVALALEMVGTAQTIFDITLEYAKQREQFGVPIGSFQAIKHKFADMIVLARAGPGARLLRRAHHRRGRPAAHERDLGRPRPRPATASASSPKRASRSTAASATRGSTTCTSTCAASSRASRCSARARGTAPASPTCSASELARGVTRGAGSRRGCRSRRSARCRCTSRSCGSRRSR